MNLTFGFATHNDHLGVWSTVQANRMLHDEVMHETEILIIDNGSSPAHARMNLNLAEHVKAGGQACRYIYYDKFLGTASRNQVFEQAAGEIVLCCDSHVLFPKGAFRKLIEHFDANPGTQDLFTGPMLLDTFTTYSTHFNSVWDGGMRGKWAKAWACECGDIFATTDTGARLGYTALADQELRQICPKCQKAYPETAMAGHEQRLRDAGYIELAKNTGNAPFEVPAFGLGAFACRKDAWLGFNDNFRGWGGEEWYIHNKYRQAGRRCILLPFLPWNHRYGNPYGHSDIRIHYKIARNYVIGHTELGEPLEKIKAEYKDLSQADWERLTKTPENPPEEQFDALPPRTPTMPPPCGGNCGQAGEPQASDSLQGWFPVLSQHAQTHLLSLMNQAEHVTDARAAFNVRNEGTDLLFIGHAATRQEISQELCDHSLKSRRWIVVRGSDSQQIIDGLANFLHHEKHWFVTYRSPQNGGMLVMSKKPADRPEEPYHISPPGYGPGTELKAILKSIGIAPDASCDCNAKANMMDMMGAKQCRQNIDTIAGWLREGAPRWSWTEKLAAAALAITTGIAFKLNWGDPFPSLIEEACSRAEKKEAEKKAAQE